MKHEFPVPNEEEKAAMWQPFTIESNGLEWMAVHSGLCLALRDPGYTGPNRALVLSFVHELGHRLVAEGVLTEEQLAVAERVGAEEAPHAEELPPGKGFARSEGSE